MLLKYIITRRYVVNRRGKKFCYRVPVKFKRSTDRGMFYAPYIPTNIYKPEFIND